MPELDLRALTGLSEAEAAARLEAEGYNELPATRQRSLLAIAWEVVREPMFLLLVACGLIYLSLGNTEEALMLLGFVVVVMGITLYQERKTERALEALRDLSSPRASVIRDRQQRRIAGREVVRGDLVLVAEGDRVPADGLLLSSMNLMVDESLLTGESAPVRKLSPAGAAVAPAMSRPGGDDSPCLFSGTLVVQGQGVVEIQAIGPHTEIGKIGKALQTLEPEDTLLQAETGRLVRRVAGLGLSLCVLVAAVYWLTHQGPDSWKEGILAGITLAMATLPEEFPVVLTIFLALGAWRISRQQVLTRRIPAIETLGAATVLCSDKTGTLTLNRMGMARLHSAAGAVVQLGDLAPATLPEEFHALIEFAILASQRNPFDPMEKAIHAAGERHLANTEHLHADWELVHEYPLSRELLALSLVWKSRGGKGYMIAAKGAPEAIADLCHLAPERRREIETGIEALARDGLRVLGVAQARFQHRELPPIQHAFDFEFLGLIGLEDPVRPNVPAAIGECHRAGIRVVMITGDYPGTARHIAHEIGLPDARVITGPELNGMSDSELQQRIRDVCIFARVVPEQKLRLVQALKANGEIVAMTGDGVNDAPALKAAHIGVAMGGRGTDVAREAAGLVLLDDDFSSIVSAIKLGRRIFDNIKKAFAYIVAIHVPIAGMSLLPVLLGLPLVLMPVHILFLELIIDPACSTVFEAEAGEKDLMSRRPRDPREPLFSGRSLWVSLAQGLTVLGMVLVVYLLALTAGKQTEGSARALAFTTLIVANLALILTNRSSSRTILETLRTPNSALWWVLGGAVGFLALVLGLPGLRAVFKFDALHPIDLTLCLAAGIVSILFFEIGKLRRRRQLRA